jgi:hypothetical protein
MPSRKADSLSLDRFSELKLTVDGALEIGNLFGGTYCLVNSSHRAFKISHISFGIG